ncbi:Cupin-like domain-containing protein [Cladophialophora immunda]|nr:Cupin-like domain-containing protein [Cladophialophora immunda]
MTASNNSETVEDFALATLLALIEDYHSFNPDTTVPTFAYPTYLEFSQQVARGRPCVYRLDRSVLDDHVTKGDREPEDESHCDNSDEPPELLSLKRAKRRHLREEQRSILSAPCFQWTKKSLCELVWEEVEVAVTPDGRADALYSLPRRRDRPRRDGFKGQALGKQRDGEVDGHDTTRGRGGMATKDGREREEEKDEEGPETEPEQVFLQPASTYMTLSTLIDKLCPPQPSSPCSPSSLSPSLTNAKSSRTTPTPTPTSAFTTTSPTISAGTKAPIYYLQSQNSNLHTPPLSALQSSLPRGPPPFSTPVLGAPEAVNVWIGNARSVTSTHRDPYENLYLVVKGRKRFVLYSPLEEVCLHAERVRTGRWAFEDQGGQNGDDGEGKGEEMGEFRIVMDDEDHGERGQDCTENNDYNERGSDTTPPTSIPLLSSPSTSEPNPGDEDTNRIPWIPIDPLSPPPATSKRYPYYKYARPLSVTVSEGEILYLPAGWFHHVTQECGFWEGDEGDGSETVAPCIAVNYWFDMDYSGEKHVMREMVGRLVERVRMTENK